jgi:hypothetical protein
MSKLPAVLVIFFIFSGCSQEPKSVGLDKKEKLTVELIKSTKECISFKTELAKPQADSHAVDQIYFTALKAHCIKSDI